MGFAGVAKWVHPVVYAVLADEAPRVLHSVQSFVQGAAERRFPETAVMVRLDFRDFFMSGTGGQLAEGLGSIFPRGRRRGIVEDCVYFLCEYQYVRSPVLPGRLWHVEIGSGVGLPQSGALADGAFYGVVERRFATLPLVQEYYAILW